MLYRLHWRLGDRGQWDKGSGYLSHFDYRTGYTGRHGADPYCVRDECGRQKFGRSRALPLQDIRQEGRDDH